jgi:hypothetical protein
MAHRGEADPGLRVVYCRAGRRPDPVAPSGCPATSLIDFPLENAHVFQNVEIAMKSPTTLAELLRDNLKDITPPEGYKELRDRLAATKPTRRPPTANVSPENIRHPPSRNSEES